MSAASELAIQELLLSRPTGDAVDAFIEAHDFPIREGPHTTFVYRGEATSVCSGTGSSGPPRRARWNGSPTRTCGS